MSMGGRSSNRIPGGLRRFGTFMMADDGEGEPVELLRTTLDAEGIARERFIALGNGQGWDVPGR